MRGRHSSRCDTGRARAGAAVRLAVLPLALILGACSGSTSPGGAVYTAEQVSCALFSRDDAAAVLGVPAAAIRATAEELYAGNWDCGFNGGGPDRLVGFNITLSPGVEEAAVDMARYRSHLETASGTRPFREGLAEGAYSEVDGLGDEALWTAVNGTLAVRQGNLSLQIRLPKDRDVQVGMARRILAPL
ncbi:MAG: hypothetical protein PHF72_04960 [Gammaproteobacteria bacterium]|nr:hypothetical protein [Gammaproteobacteria bacterium]